jgi:peptidyl-prolyl cis-trans isomerase SurA
MRSIASLLCVLSLLATATLSNAQPKSAKPVAPVVEETKKAVDPVLFNLGTTPVQLSEFQYVYNKNNTNSPDAFTQKSLEDYLNLYINFRMKVKEAMDMGMDTIESINKELGTYRQQLAKSYLFDKEVNEQLIDEAYQRIQKEIKASHILISIDDSGLPADTLEAYKKALDIRKRLLKGEDFATLARQNSADPSAKTNGGDIGYFTVFQTVYPFENAVYSMKSGEISMPVRTKFGYHVVKVTDVREAMGKMKAAHILLKLPLNATPEQEKEVAQKAEVVYNESVSGTESFEKLVEKYSEDRQTFKKNGELPEFGIGKMVQEFETAAFALKKDGDIAKPVKTEFGFHIIKRISRESLPTFEESKTEIKKKVERDSRSSVAKHKMVEKIKKEYGFTENVKSKDALFKRVGSNLMEGKFEVKDKEQLKETLFTLAGKNYTQEDFVTFLEERQKKKRTEPAMKIYNDYYDIFVDETCLNYEESQLERKYPDFKSLMKEYHDGILLFELTDKKVWSKAVTDTTGLKAFYETVKNKYMWGERADVEIYTLKPEVVKAARKLIVKGQMSPGEIAAKYNIKGAEQVKFETGLYEKGQNETVSKMTWAAGVSENINNPEATVTIVRIKKINPASPKSLNETKGFVISDYQEFLEKSWLEELRKKYPVTIVPGVLNTLVKKQ